MKIDLRVFNYSLWFSLLTILIFPGRIKTEGRALIEYGFPFGFFVPSRHDIWFIRGVSIDLLKYFLNAIIIYALLIWIRKIFRRVFYPGIKAEDED